MNLLEIRNLAAGYGTPVLRGVSLTVKDGEFVGILGPNGCGKTTLLRAVLGQIAPFSGEILLSGTNADTLSVRQRAQKLAYMPQQMLCADGMRASDVIETAFFARQGVFASPTRAQKEAIRREAERFCIGDLLSRDISSLSAGQRQLVWLVRTAVQDAPLWLLDEPNSALDLTHTQNLLLAVREHAQTGGALVVLHDPAAALRFCHRILLMRNGTLCGELTPEILHGEPETIRQALSVLYPNIRVIRDDGIPLCYPADEIRRTL